MNRRQFLVRSACALAVPAVARPVSASTGLRSTWITLVPRAGAARDEVVNVGVPLAPGWLVDPARVRVADARGREIPVSARVLERWRAPARDGTADAEASIRSVQIQFPFRFDRAR